MRTCFLKLHVICALQGMLAAWVERDAAEVQVHTLLLGFETDVYAPPDYCMIFWCALLTCMHDCDCSTLYSQSGACKPCSGIV